MKLNKISLKWKLFFYIITFAIVIIVIFCVFQILLLGNIYRNTKITQTKTLMRDVYQEINGQNINNFYNKNSNLIKNIDELLTNTETDVYLIERIDADNYDVVYPSNVSINMIERNLQNLYTDDIMKLFKDIYNKTYPNIAKFIIFNNSEQEAFNMVYSDNSDIISNNTIIYIQQVLLADNQPYLIFINARLTPVQPAIDTLKTQLLYITMIVFVLSIVVALIMARTISKPIIDINNGAKTLAKGDYTITFNGKGYKEISELNDTLNYTVMELKKTENLQRELLANVSHDIRTPLTLISGYAEMIRDMPSENNKENIQIIIDEAKRLNLLVDDLLSLSRINARTEPLNIDNFNIIDTLKNIVSRQQKFVENLDFKIDLICDNETIFVKADEKKIEQVLYNFITNAINYSDKIKEIKVIETKEAKSVTIKIVDYGIGIKKEELDCIWQRYYRVDKGHMRSTQGSGIGLSIIKSILDYHNFEYGVESKENEGSIFWFKIPLE